MPPTVKAVHAENGYETEIRIDGAGEGRNAATVRIFPTVPSGDFFYPEWEGREHAFRINGLAERGIATFGDEEVRFDVTTPKGMELRLPVPPRDAVMAVEDEPSEWTVPVSKRLTSRGLLSEGKS